MIIFKTCIKILNKNKLMLLIYFGIFAGMSIALANNAKEQMAKSYETANVRISVINEDNSEYADSLISYLERNANMTDIVETEEGIADALFYRYTEYVICIPEDFGERMAKGEAVSLAKYEVQGSYSGMFMDTMINEYIGKMKLYGPEVPESSEVSVEILGEETEESSVSLYNFTGYAMLAIVILGVGALITAFSREDIRRRNYVSPVSAVKIGMAQIGGSLFFTLIVWGLLAVIIAAVIGVKSMGVKDLYMLLNMLLYALVCLAIGFCISAMIKSVNGRTIAANVISLGFSFIGGVMVPLSVMGDTVKIVGSFTPTYWFVRANEALNGLTGFRIRAMSEIWGFMGIEILFMIAFLAIGLAAQAYKKLL